MATRPILAAVANNLPQAPPPGGLESVSIPSTPERIRALFSALPDRIEGLPRQRSREESGSAFRAGYGETAQVIATDASLGEFSVYRNTAPQSVALWSLGSDWDVEAAGRWDGLFWALSNTTANGQPVYMANWGVADTTWEFGVIAPSSTLRGQLLAAVVLAAERGGSDAQ